MAADPTMYASKRSTSGTLCKSVLIKIITEIIKSKQIRMA
jgi:hypothetical protein